MGTTIRYLVGNWVAACVVAWFSGGVTAWGATVDQYGGSKAVWPTTTWAPLSGLNDPDDAGYAEKLDFVGDGTNPGAYWAQDSQYIYFRARMHEPNVVSGTYSDTLHVLIDRRGYGQETGLPDYGFSWDSKSGNNTNHGLEMTVLYSTAATTWGSVKMDDVDGSDGQKLSLDINGAGRTGDGYVQSISGQSTTAFGNTSFIDFAVSWDYLTNIRGSTVLGPGQTWRIALASTANATDHNVMSTDIAGGASLTTGVTTGWSGEFQTQNVPEPSSLVVLSVVALTSYVGFRFRRGKGAAVEKAAM